MRRRLNFRRNCKKYNQRMSNGCFTKDNNSHPNKISSIIRDCLKCNCNK